MQRTCKQCGKYFILTQSEIAYYQRNHLELPKRCSDCRKANKQIRHEKTSENSIPNRRNRLIFLTLFILVLFLSISQFIMHQPEDSTYVKTSSDSTYEQIDSNSNQSKSLTFRSASLCEEHFEKHGKEMGFQSANEYEVAAASVVSNPSSLHKTEAEDGDDVYYLESTNDFVIVSTDGYIRTYFQPEDKIEYFNRQ